MVFKVNDTITEKIKIAIESLDLIDNERKALWNQGMSLLQSGDISNGLNFLQKSNELFERFAEEQHQLLSLLASETHSIY